MSKTLIAEADMNKQEIGALTKAGLETMIQSWASEVIFRFS